MTYRPTTDKQEDCYLHWYGTIILARGRDSDGMVSIDDDHDLLRSAFYAGWSWGAELGAEKPPEEEKP